MHVPCFCRQFAFCAQHVKTLQEYEGSCGSHATGNTTCVSAGLLCMPDRLTASSQLLTAHHQEENIKFVHCIRCASLRNCHLLLCVYSGNIADFTNRVEDMRLQDLAEGDSQELVSQVTPSALNLQALHICHDCNSALLCRIVPHSSILLQHRKMHSLEM